VSPPGSEQSKVPHVLIVSFNRASKTNLIPTAVLSHHEWLFVVGENQTNLLRPDIRSIGHVLEYETLPALRAAIQPQIGRRGAIRVYCNTEEYVVDAAVLRSTLGIHGIRPDEAAAFRNKLLMKQMVAAAGCRVPRCGRLERTTSYRDIVEMCGSPFVLKPVEGMGSYGVTVVENEVQFRATVDRSDASSFQYEEYIEGELFHVDFVIQGGSVLFMGLCEYSSTGTRFVAGESSMSIEVSKSHPAADGLKTFSRKALAGLGAHHGIVHMEVFWDRKCNEPVFLEAGIRTPGGSIVPQYHRKYGFDMVTIGIQLELGAKVDLPRSIDPHHYMSGIFPTKPGVLKSVVQPQILSSYDMTCRYVPGDVLPVCRSVQDVAASIIAENSRFATLRADFERLRGFSPLQMA
jgi:hypothetical protein